MVFHFEAPLPWRLITRLGEAQILMPPLLALLGWFVWRLRARQVALTWLACVVVAAVITTITKVAFLGWGVGSAAWDFTGISGHAMFAAAVLPLLAAADSSTTPRWQPVWITGGYLLAIVIAFSRLVVQAHSASEAIAGFALGSAASGVALWRAEAPHTHAPKLLLAATLVWLTLGPAGAPPSPAHGMVTRLSLFLSGHSQPYTRQMMMERYRLEQQQRDGSSR
jgi:membrane-associated phospholipid phosphatase